MLNPLFDIAALEQDIRAERLILTPNHRLARAIRSAWGQHCHGQRSQKRWPQPQIYAVESWLQECWQQLLDQCYAPALQGCVLSDHGAALLWQAAIASDRGTPADIDPANFVRLATQAWRDLQRWGIPTRQLAASHHSGSQYFLRWLRGFQRLLAERRLLTREDSYTLITGGFEDGTLHRFTNIVTVGFQTTPPLYARVLAAAASTVVEHTPLRSSAAQTTQIYTLGATDANAEIAAAAHWAREQHANDPQQRIGVVFSNLNRMRDRVERLFRDQFAPSHCLPDYPHEPASFNLSAGIPLRQTPLVDTAITLLGLHDSVRPSLEEYCALLNNPFWGSGQPDLALRSLGEVSLRKLGKVNPGSEDLRKQLQRAQEALQIKGRGLCEILQETRELARHRPRRATFAHWAQHCAEQLEVFGWPGPRTLDSIEYQQTQRWLAALEELAALDTYSDEVSYAEALAELRQLTTNVVFQPETPDAPVQVLGLLEAAGLRFDKLWVAGMDSTQWPQATVYNPLLPPALQRQWQLPKACPEQELILAQKLFSQFDNCAAEVVFSYARMDGDTELRPSALLDALAPYPLMPATSSAVSNRDTGDETIFAGLLDPQRTASVELETVPIDSAPPLDPQPQALRGGSALLRDQAGCPFNAFAIWRLGATPLPEPVPGLSPQDRGILIHRCLELLWRQLESQANLLALDQIAVDTLLEQVISDVLAPMKQRRPDVFGVRFARLEQQRLRLLLLNWLEIDRARSPFVVTPPEQEITLTLGGLILNLRVDRIDQLPDGELVLIDYKTGNGNITDWGGERPADPQLPLYALHAQAPIAALCFARVSASKGTSLYGIAENPDLLPKLEPLARLQLPATWPETRDYWHRALTVLADEFCNGNTQITFYNSSAERNQSYLLPLNRAAEQGALVDHDRMENGATANLAEEPS